MYHTCAITVSYGAGVIHLFKKVICSAQAAV